MPDRHHHVSQLTVGELERTRRDLRVSLALITPGSPAGVPILAHIGAIDAELAERAADEQDNLPGQICADVRDPTAARHPGGAGLGLRRDGGTVGRCRRPDGGDAVQRHVGVLADLRRVRRHP